MDWLAEANIPDTGLRYYQRQAVDALAESLKTHRSALCVMATGTGKTQIGVTLAQEWPGSVLWLAHRDELVQQARERMEQITGEWIDQEQGHISRAYNARLVVGSVQTVQREKRLKAFKPDRFSLVIFDEAAHAPARTFRKPLDYFKDAKLVGLTATPDRADNIALGQLFEDVPEGAVFDIRAAIDDGWLVPLDCERVYLDEIDLSLVKKSAGDLQVGQLDEVMIKAVEGICRKTIEIEPNRRAICFFPGVKSAELAMERFNALVPDSAIMLSAKTEQSLRRELVREWKRGKFQYLCNVQIATEGFDSPDVSLIVLGRPTLSRSLHAQMIGRGTRPLAGIVDGLPDPAMAAERRKTIQGSNKPNCKILDFVGNGGKHSLITPIDIFAGRYTEPELKLAKKREKEKGGNPIELLEAARRELKELAAAMQSRIKARQEKYDPFNALGSAEDDKYTRRFGFKAPSFNQKNLLSKFGVEADYLQSLSRGQAGKLLDDLFQRRKNGLATYKQMRILRKWGITQGTVTFTQASEAISYLKTNEWGKKVIDTGRLDSILHRQREPGEEG